MQLKEVLTSQGHSLGNKIFSLTEPKETTTTKKKTKQQKQKQKQKTKKKQPKTKTNKQIKTKQNKNKNKNKNKTKTNTLMHASKAILNLPTSSLHLCSPFQQNR